ncbi:MAG TPA: hypothetical protein VF053_17770 [Streptosporangiales bacterium]
MGNTVAVGRTTAAPAQLVLRIVTCVGLVADAGVHLHLARSYDVVAGGIGQGNLFRIESVVSLIVAVLILVVRRWWMDAIAFLVAGSALLAVLASTYVHIGAVGPIPDMYEPIWYLEKVLVTTAEAMATVSALVAAVLAFRARDTRRAPSRRQPAARSGATARSEDRSRS